MPLCTFFLSYLIQGVQMGLNPAKLAAVMNTSTGR